VIIGTKIEKEQLSRILRPDQVVIDLVNLNAKSRPAAAAYDGICW
jgi:hypothetical protein